MSELLTHRFLLKRSVHVAQVRAVGDAILKDRDANKLPGFQIWRDTRKLECMGDDVLKFINDRRNSDLHEGNTSLVFAMHPRSFNSERVRTSMPPGTTLYVGGTGTYWITGRGTPDDRRVPCEGLQDYYISAAVLDPPTSHLGRPVQSDDPVSICEMALRYYELMLWDARKQFEP